MQWRSVARAFGASRPLGVLVVAAVAVSAGGCSMSSSSNGRASLAGPLSSGSTIAFESIDGPPPEVFGRLVTSLNEEAGSRQIAVVSRSGAATYRVRGYMSAIVERDKTTFAWVWDVYDTDKRRALRITGEEPGAASRRRDAWAAADEAVLRRMARSGMERMAVFLNSPAPAAPAAAPEPSLMTLVSGRDDTPEGAGIFRIFGGQEQPAAGAPPETAPEASPPPDRVKDRVNPGRRQPTAAAPPKRAATLAAAQ
jgi:hypothetical protein